MKKNILLVVGLVATALMNASWENQNNNPNTPYQSHKRDRDQSSENQPKKLQRQRTPEASPESTSSSVSSNASHRHDGMITQANSPLSPEGQLELLTVYNQLHVFDQGNDDLSDNESTSAVMHYTPNLSDLDTEEGSDIEDGFITPPHVAENMFHTPETQNLVNLAHNFIFTTPQQLVATGITHHQIALGQDIDQAVMTPEQLAVAMHIVTPN